MNAPSPILELESAFAALHSAPAAVATGMGRAALYLALEAAGVRGKQVLVPDFICAQVLHAVRAAGATPVFYSVPLDLVIQPDAFAGALAQQPCTAILVHYFGAPQPHIATLVQQCRERSVVAIEDCALALLAEGAGGFCGTHADFATYSFTKSNWCYGGGMALARDAESAARLRRMADNLLVADDDFCLAYGRLCQLDFDANRPSRAREAAARGASLQEELARRDPRFCDANFFDAAPCNLRMSTLAAERAFEILRTERERARRRSAACARLLRNAGGRLDEDQSWRLLAGQTYVLQAARHSASHVVVCYPEGSSNAWIARAAEQGITLRPVWPDFQPSVPQTVHRGRLASLEIHPDLVESEVDAIAHFLRESSA